MHAAPAAECAARLPAVGRVVDWDYESGVRLFGSDGSPLLVFGEAETTIMKTGFETPPIHFLLKAPASVERAPYAPAFTGAWMLQRPGGPARCTLALFKGSEDEATGLTVETGTPCDPAVARMHLDSARGEDFKLIPVEFRCLEGRDRPRTDDAGDHRSMRPEGDEQPEQRAGDHEGPAQRRSCREARR